ncbi:MAG: DUF721 domain-containing protein [Chitinophagales bacterium]
MTDNNLTSLSDALDKFAQQKKMKKPILEARIVSYWKEMMGDLVNKYTQKIYIQGKTLFVKVEAAALKNELLFSKEQIISRINTQFGENTISKLVVL